MTAPSIVFGPFSLLPGQRLLLEEDKPVRLGSRALDILIALLERPGELVTKQELIARVWSGLIVDDANLKVHVMALRRVLRDGHEGSRYICTVPGRGYCFVAPAIQCDGPVAKAADGGSLGLPEFWPVSGADLISSLAGQLALRRFMMVVGAGDVASGMFLAAAFMSEYEHGVRFVDLALVNDPHLVPSAVVTAIGREGNSGDPLADMAAFLEDRHVLLVLGNCRHVIEAIIAFAREILKSASKTYILAISQ